jgi:hypothetical protein
MSDQIVPVIVPHLCILQLGTFTTTSILPNSAAHTDLLGNDMLVLLQDREYW